MHRILIVDDELLIADTLGTIFRKNGFDVRTAYSAAQALLCARQFQPDLLVSDIGMPGRTGLELSDDINRELPNCRILFLTAQHTNRAIVVEQSRRMPRSAGFLTKPCHPSDLLREAGAILGEA